MPFYMEFSKRRCIWLNLLIIMKTLLLSIMYVYCIGLSMVSNRHLGPGLRDLLLNYPVGVFQYCTDISSFIPKTIMWYILYSMYMISSSQGTVLYFLAISLGYELISPLKAFLYIKPNMLLTYLPNSTYLIVNHVKLHAFSHNILHLLIVPYYLTLLIIKVLWLLCNI